MNWGLVENLRSYCLWAHPFMTVANDDIEDPTYMIKHDGSNPHTPIALLINTEIQYLERTLSSIIEDFKSHINTIIQL
jgi:hypothetical protein